MPRLTIDNPLNEEEKIRVSFKVINHGEEDEPDVEIQLKAIERKNGDDFIDASAEWSKRHAVLEEVEEIIKEKYIDIMREKYVDRMSRY